MSRPELNFQSEGVYSVSVENEEFGEIGNGTLHFSPSSGTYITFGIFEPPNKLPIGMLDQPLTLTTPDGRDFTCFGCDKKSNHIIHVEFLTTNKTCDAFRVFYVRYNDISEWFIGHFGVKGIAGEQISWRQHDQIAATITTKSEIFNLSTDTSTISEQDRETLHITQYVTFRFENCKGHFTSNDIKTKTSDLARLLGILTDHPISIISVDAESENDKHHSIIFPTYRHKTRKTDRDTFLYNCFADHGLVYPKWSKILNNYFNSENMPLTWTRFAGMLHYDGFWEYEVAGIIFILDRYLESTTSSLTTIANTVRRGVLKGLESKLNSSTKLQLTSSQTAKILSLIESTFSYKRPAMFMDRFMHAANNIDSRIYSIIDITKEDIERLKNVRDSIAHGGELPVTSGREVTALRVLVQKIRLLLTYWAFIEFGFTPDEFIMVLRSPSRLRLRSEINHICLERIVHPEHFFNIAPSDINTVSAIRKNTNLCFTKNSSGILKFSQKHVSMYKAWDEGDKSWGLEKGRLVAEKILDLKDGEEAKCLGTAYIECGATIIELTLIWIISTSESTANS